jgi:hypothetical protein
MMLLADNRWIVVDGLLRAISLFNKLIEKIKDTHLGNHQGVPFATVISENKSFYHEKKIIFHLQRSFFILG